jgi:hypothetical protein
MNIGHVWSVIRNAWPVLGPLVGIWIGAYLTTRNQKRQWILDHKRAEYRELLTAIGDVGSKLVLYYGTNPFVANSDEQLAIWEATRTTVDVIYNRLFIAQQIEKLLIQSRWENAVSLVRKNRDVRLFGHIMDGIMNDIRNTAIKEFS